MLQYAYCGTVDVESEDIEGFEKVLESLKIEYDIEGPDDGEYFSDDDELSSNAEMPPKVAEIPPKVAEITEHGEYCEMDIEEPKWSEVKVKQEPKDEEDGNLVATTSTAAMQLTSRKPHTIALPKIDPDQIPAPRFVKITSQSNNFKRIVVTNQRPSIAANKSLTPEMKTNVHRPTAEMKPIVHRPHPLPLIRKVVSTQKQSLQPSQTIKFNASPGGKIEGKIHLGRVVPSKILQKFMNENPGICPFCKKHFKTPKHRNEHVKYCFQNPNRIVSVCPLCDKNVCDPYYLRKHMKNVHGNETASSSSRDSS